MFYKPHFFFKGGGGQIWLQSKSIYYFQLNTDILINAYLGKEIQHNLTLKGPGHFKFQFD